MEIGENIYMELMRLKYNPFNLGVKNCFNFLS